MQKIMIPNNHASSVSHMVPDPTVKPGRQTSYTRRTAVGNEIVGHSDVVGASPIGGAPTTSSSKKCNH